MLPRRDRLRKGAHPIQLTVVRIAEDFYAENNDFIAKATLTINLCRNGNEYPSYSQNEKERGSQHSAGPAVVFDLPHVLQYSGQAGFIGVLARPVCLQGH